MDGIARFRGFFSLTVLASILLNLGCGSPKSNESSKQNSANKDAKGSVTEIDGKWECISAETEGIPFKEHIGQEYKFEKGKVTIWSNRGEEEGFMFFALDTTQTPKHFDSWFEKQENRPAPGIYKLKNDTLTICELILDKKPRPDEFSTAKGDNRLLRVLRRIE